MGGGHEMKGKGIDWVALDGMHGMGTPHCWTGEGRDEKML